MVNRKYEKPDLAKHIYDYTKMSSAQQLIGYRPFISLRKGLPQEFNAIVTLYHNKVFFS
jgi:hypothetical protein